VAAFEAANSCFAVRRRLIATLGRREGRRHRSLTRCAEGRCVHRKRRNGTVMAPLLTVQAAFLVAACYSGLGRFSCRCVPQVEDTCPVSAGVAVLACLVSAAASRVEDKDGPVVAIVVGNLEVVAAVDYEGTVVAVDVEGMVAAVDDLGRVAAATLDVIQVAVHCTVSVVRVAVDASLVVDGLDDGASHDGDDVCDRLSVLCVPFLPSSCYLCELRSRHTPQRRTRVRRGGPL